MSEFSSSEFSSSELSEFSLSVSSRSEFGGLSLLGRSFVDTPRLQYYCGESLSIYLPLTYRFVYI